MADPQFSDNDSSGSTITYEEGAVTEAQALNFINSVKLCFGRKSKEFGRFVRILSDFNQNRIMTVEVTDRIKILFSEHQELIEGFNHFLPARYRINLPVPSRSDPYYEEAVAYYMKVKSAYSQEKERINTFIRLLQTYNQSEMSLVELNQKVRELFWDRQDLFEGFQHYMPDR